VSSVDVVVVSYNSRAHLRRCVEPLAGAGGIRVLVVDNASLDDSLEAVDDLPLRAFRMADNRGFAAGCNAGWRAANGDHVLFLNPDAVIEPEAVASLARVLEEDPAAGAVAPRIVHEDGALHWSQRRFPTLRSLFAQALYLHRIFPRGGWTDELIRDEDAYAQPGAPDWVSGACVLVRRTVLDRLDGLDEGFFMYWEDTDLCRRIRDLGLEVRFEPSATAVHVGGASTPAGRMIPVLAASRLRYTRKHHGRVRAAVERVGIALEAITHALVARGGAETRAGHLRTLRALGARDA